MSGELVLQVLYGLVPTAGILVVFYIIIRAIIRADAGERRAAEQFRPQVPGSTASNPDGSGQRGGGEAD